MRNNFKASTAWDKITWIRGTTLISCRMCIGESMVGNLGLLVILIRLILDKRRNVLNEDRCALSFKWIPSSFKWFDRMLELSMNDQEWRWQEDLNRLFTSLILLFKLESQRQIIPETSRIIVLLKTQPLKKETRQNKRKSEERDSYLLTFFNRSKLEQL